jgi:very-short-patch-repair endonuclease
MSPTPRHLRANARTMRRAPTDAERALWRLLRDRRFSGYKFRRQTPLGPFIVDFLCFEARLIVEADGGQHADNSYDRDRDAWLAAQGFRIRRFWNVDILTQPTMVADTLWHDLTGG